jgi:hypothetical protein
VAVREAVTIPLAGPGAGPVGVLDAAEGAPESEHRHAVGAHDAPGAHQREHAPGGRPTHGESRRAAAG